MSRHRPRRSRRVPVLFLGLLLGAGAAAAWDRFVARIGELADPKASRTLRVPAGAGRTRSFVLGPANPYWTPLRAISRDLVRCVLAAEDERFYEHRGVDWAALREALETNLARGRYARGGSTITMQLAKNLFLWRKNTLLRKVLEVILAWRLERALTKERILELYLNAVEWGPGIYGVGEASQRYFGKHPSRLTLEDAALLAAILPNPVRWNPLDAPAAARRRQRQLLERIGSEAAGAGAAR